MTPEKSQQLFPDMTFPLDEVLKKHPGCCLPAGQYECAVHCYPEDGTLVITILRQNGLADFEKKLKGKFVEA